MDASELANYEFQLQQVETSLAKDPSNAELKKLAGDLSELITITRSLLPSAPTPAAAPPAPRPPKTHKAHGAARPPQQQREPLPPADIFTEPVVLPVVETVEEPVFPSEFSVNDKVQAKWSRDNAWYPATIQSISGGTTAATKIYSVRFVGYDTVDLVKADKIRWPQSVKKQSSSTNAPAAAPPPPPTTGGAPPAAEEESTAPGGKMKTRRPGKATLEEHKAKKAAELNSKTSNWRNFASKSKVAINNKSIFRTPEGNTGRVGVVGSGQPMTESQRQGRWK